MKFFFLDLRDCFEFIHLFYYSSFLPTAGRFTYTAAKFPYPDLSGRSILPSRLNRDKSSKQKILHNISKK